MKFKLGISSGHKVTPRREPLRTLGELAEEFGVTRRTLVNYLVHRDGPKPELRLRETRSSGSKIYYKPSEVRKWWKEKVENTTKELDCLDGGK